MKDADTVEKIDVANVATIRDAASPNQADKKLSDGKLKNHRTEQPSSQLPTAIKHSATKARRLFWVFPDRFDTRLDKSSWLEMARHLETLGWDVQIVAASLAKDADDYGGLIKYVRSVRLPFIFRILLLIRIAQFIRSRLAPDDIVLMNQDALWLVPILRNAGARHIHLDIRTLPVSEAGAKNSLDHLLFWRLPIKWFGQLPDTCSFITEPLRQQFIQEFANVNQPHCIWESGVNTRLFRRTNPRSPAHDEDVFKLFYHGSLTRTRGIDLVLQAIAQGQYPFKIHFTVVGEGTGRAYLSQMATELKIADAVSFLGYVPYEEIADLVNEADCCVCPLPDMPEWRISSPLKVLEYLACEQLIVLTPLAAHKQVIDDADSIVWTRDYSPKAFAEAFKIAYERRKQTPETRRKVRDWVSRNFEWEVHAKKLHSLLISRSAKNT
jgi:glycosyltransferase involved in cell wall biosynthesis